MPLFGVLRSMTKRSNEITGQIKGVHGEGGAMTHVSILGTSNNRIKLPIAHTSYDECWWRDRIGQQVKITISTKVEIIGRKAKDICPDKVGKYLIQITKPLPYNRVIIHIQNVPDSKLYKLSKNKYIAIRKVGPDDSVDAIGLIDGEWEQELIDKDVYPNQK